MSRFDPFGWGARRKARQEAIQAQRMRDEVKAERGRFIACKHNVMVAPGEQCGQGCPRRLPHEVPRLEVIWR